MLEVKNSRLRKLPGKSIVSSMFSHYNLISCIFLKWPNFTKWLSWGRFSLHCSGTPHLVLHPLQEKWSRIPAQTPRDMCWALNHQVSTPWQPYLRPPAPHNHRHAAPSPETHFSPVNTSPMDGHTSDRATLTGSSVSLQTHDWLSMPLWILLVFLLVLPLSMSPPTNAHCTQLSISNQLLLWTKEMLKPENV